MKILSIPKGARGRLLPALLSVVFLVSAAPVLRAEGMTEAEFKDVLGFYREGSSFCFRLVPALSADAEKQWTIVALTSQSNAATKFMCPALELAAGTKVKGDTTVAVQAVFKDPRNRREFFARFGAEMDKKVLKALVLKSAPIEPNSEVDMASARAISSAELLDLASQELWEPPSPF